MTDTLVIAAREVRERILVFTIAAYVAALPFAILWLGPSARRGEASHMIGAVGSVTAFNFALALAIMFGTTMVVRDLAEKRLSFYFARPVAGTSIWFGKLLGAATVIAGSFAIIFVPSLVAGWRTWHAGMAMAPQGIVALAAFVSFFSLLLFHAVATMVRSRSAIAAVDLVAAAVTGLVVWRLGSMVLQAGATALAGTMARVLAVAIALILVAGGAWQVSRGRADLRRSHVELSKFIWTAAAAMLMLFAAYVAWLFSAVPSDLTTLAADQSPRGDRVMLYGKTRFRGDYEPRFVLDARSGRWTAWPGQAPEFTRDGAVAFAYGLQPAGRMELIVQRLGRDGKPRHTGITNVGNVVFTNDHARLAVLDGNGISVHEIDADRLVAAASFPRGVATKPPLAFFVSPDVVRIFAVQYSQREHVLRVFEFDTARRRLEQTGTWSTPRPMWLRASADGATLVAYSDESAVFLDGRTAAERNRLRGTLFKSRILADGRLAEVRPDGTLTIGGGPSIPLGWTGSSYIAGETADGKLLIGIREGEPGIGRYSTIVVDMRSGRVVRREDALRVHPQIHGNDPRVPVPYQTNEIVALDSTGRYLLWNVDTGAKRNLV